MHRIGLLKNKKPSGNPEDDKYTYRIFCTNLAGKAHRNNAEYDKRTDAENLVGEAKREGMHMIPSAKFKNNYAFFQTVMLAYNIWRYMKMRARCSLSADAVQKGSTIKGIVTNTVCIARLKLLFIAAKGVKDSNRDKVKYSIHDSRTPEMLSFLHHLDKRCVQLKPGLNRVTGPSDLRYRPEKEFSCTNKMKSEIIILKAPYNCLNGNNSPR